MTPERTNAIIRRMRPGPIHGLALLLASLFLGTEANAQIFKYKKPDGTVVYTDSLAQLPPARRAYYNRKLQEQERKRREAVQRLGKDEYERREKEKELEALRKRQMDEAERKRRIAAINAVLDDIRQRKKSREADEAAWRKKAKEAKEKVDRLLAEFNETQEKYKKLALNRAYALPGQQQERLELQKKLEKLEPELDAAIEYLNFGLPEEARKAGVPPGWIR